MRVKIGDTWYSSSDQPICVQLSEQDKRNISNMLPSADKYASFPDHAGMGRDEMLDWMSDTSSQADNNDPSLPIQIND